MSRLTWLALADLLLLMTHLSLGVPGRLAFGAGHLGLSLAGVLAIRGSQSLGGGWDRLPVPLGLAGGPLAMLLLALLRPWAMLRLPARPARPRQALPTRPGTTPPIVARIADGRLRYPPAKRLQSLALVLRHGDLPSRCDALRTVVRSFEPRLSPLVTAALHDPDQTVRALAAATSAQVNANVSSRLAAIAAEPPPVAAERFDAAMMLFDHGVNNVLLSQAQRVAVRSQAHDLLLGLAANAECPSRLRAPVAAALVRLKGRTAQPHRHSSAGPGPQGRPGRTQ